MNEAGETFRRLSSVRQTCHFILGFRGARVYAEITGAAIDSAVLINIVQTETAVGGGLRVVLGDVRVRAGEILVVFY